MSFQLTDGLSVRGMDSPTRARSGLPTTMGPDCNN